MNNKIRRIWSIVSTLLVAAVALFAVMLVGVRLVGLQVYTVLSGSMEPEYKTGSLIYVKKVDPEDIEVGQVITFMLDADTVATHRVIEIIPDETDPEVIRFRTKGDANDAPDGGAVHCKNVIGTPVLCIPYLGYAANYIQNPPGMYIAIAIGAVLMLLVFLPDVFAEDKNGSMLRTRLNDLRQTELCDAELDEQIDAITERLLTPQEVQAIRGLLKRKAIGSKDEAKILTRMKKRRAKGGKTPPEQN
ncbi:MAG: signal peptidase I [Candidatus Flemingiibacterium sp.]